MKLLTKEQEKEHYNATLKGGAIGGALGLGVGLAGVYVASVRYHFFRNLTLPLKAFLVTSSGTFAGIVSADHASRAYESDRNPIDREYKEREQQQYEAGIAGKSFTQRAMDFGKKERYKIVGASWIASMATAFALVNRNKYLSGQQKLVQARVYAQFLTLGVLVATAAFEISDSKNQEGRYEVVRYVDPTDPEHKRMLEKRVEKEGSRGGEQQSDGDDLWKDMVAAEEQRLKEREAEEKKVRAEHEKKGKKSSPQKDEKNGSKDKKDDSKDKKDDSKDKKDDSKDKKDDSKDKKDDPKDKKDDSKDKKDDSKDKKDDSKDKKNDSKDKKDDSKDKKDDSKDKKSGEGGDDKSDKKKGGK